MDRNVFKNNPNAVGFLSKQAFKKTSRGIIVGTLTGDNELSGAAQLRLAVPLLRETIL